MLLDLDGQLMMQTVVVGSVSSSRGVSLDPDRIKRESQPHTWVKEGDIGSIPAFRDSLVTHGVQVVYLKTDDGAPEGEVRSLVSAPVPSPEVRERILFAARLPAEEGDEGDTRFAIRHAPVRRPKGWRPAGPPHTNASMDEVEAGIEKMLWDDFEQVPCRPSLQAVPAASPPDDDEEDEKASDHRARAVARWACGYSPEEDDTDDEESA